MKGNLLQGTARGRMGDIVAKVLHGKQVFAKYQPVVFNPKSQKQITQRDLFTRAVIFSKGIVNNGYVTNTYAILRGVSRSMYVNINRVAIFTGRMKAGAQGYSNKISEPLMIKSINENIFNNEFQHVAQGITPLINGALPTSSNLYFGSISEFKGTRSAITAIFTDSSSDIGVSTLTTVRLLTKVPVTKPENERQLGFQNSSDDCGNWPYIYEIEVGAGLIFSDAEPSALTVGSETCKLSHLIYSTTSGEDFGYDIANDISPIPTPAP